MNKKNVSKRQKAEAMQEFKKESVRTAEYPQIEEAVARAVQEYGETLKKLAKDD